MSVRILIGDVRERLAEMPDDSIDCVVTSPPYWGLRDYGVAGQIGLERTLGEHIETMVDVFSGVRRVLKPSGTLWLNYGDCYATSPNGTSAADKKAAGNDDRTFRDKPFSTVGAIYDPAYERSSRVGKSGNRGSAGADHGGRVLAAGGYLKPKDLCMVPNRIAIALQEAGWWVRSEIIWAKPNPMPESIKDRPSVSHEKIWLLSKSPRYHYDHAAVRQGRASDEDANSFRGGSYVDGEPGKRTAVGNKRVDKQRGHSRKHAGFNDRWDAMEKAEQVGNGRSLRNYEPAPLDVWPMATVPFPDAHFATFPPELAERCLKAGCPKGGTVLDPFGGSGTVGLVADRMGLACTLIELNPAYADMSERRISGDAGMFASVELEAAE